MTAKKPPVAREPRSGYGSGENRALVDGTVSARPIPAEESGALADRIRQVVGANTSAFARQSGVSEAVLRSYINDGRSPSIENAAAIARTGGVMVDWLATGRPPKTEAEFNAMRHGISLDSKSSVSGYVLIPFYSAVQASAGNGALVGEEHVVEGLMFQEDWVRIELGIRPKDLFLIRVAGDSMEPTLRSRDAIMVDRRATRPDREGIYVLSSGDLLSVKRLQALPGGRIRVSSDNPAYAATEVGPENLNGHDTVVVGRVVWTGRRL